MCPGSYNNNPEKEEEEEEEKQDDWEEWRAGDAGRNEGWWRRASSIG